MSAPDTRKVVVAALAGNLAIATCKFAAAFLSGSLATLAEAVHSLADTGNELLLLLGIHLAKQPADERYPFGRATELYFWPFVVALILFSVGGAFGMYEGVKRLVWPDEAEPVRILTLAVGGHGFALSSSWLNYAVLGVSFLFESLSFRVAYREFKHVAKGKPLVETLLGVRDPTVALVLVEDLTALVGLTVAFVAVVLRHWTGHEYWDALGSLLIGVLLTFVAWTLARLTHRLLIGFSATPEDQARALAITEGTPGVVRVTQLLGVHLGPDVVLLAVKTAFAPELTAKGIEDVTNEIERRLRGAMPKMKKIFIEVDAKGDLRGVATARALLESHKELLDKPPSSEGATRDKAP